jgi:hypothetical protein
MYHSNTEYLNELKKSNTFWLLVLTEFNFLRGSEDWATTDRDGNPIKYRWVVGKFNKEVTPNA